MNYKLKSYQNIQKLLNDCYVVFAVNDKKTNKVQFFEKSSFRLKQNFDLESDVSSIRELDNLLIVNSGYLF